MRVIKMSFRGGLGLLMAGLLGMSTLPAVADNGYSAPATTAQEAAQRAILHNPEVQAKWHTFLAAIDERRVYKSGYLPSIDLDARVGRQFDRFDGSNAGNYHFNQATLQLTQMLYDGFFTRNLVRQFDHAMLVRYYELMEGAQSIAYEAVRAYEDVQRQRELVSLARDNYRQHREVFEQIERRVQAGVGRMVDLEQIGGRLALAESNLIVEVSNLHDVSARYLRIVGELPAENLLPLAMLSEGIPDNVSEALNLAYQAHPAFHAAIENITSTEYLRRRDRSEFYPQLSLRLRNTWNQGIDAIPERRESAVIELALRYNLYAGGRTSATSKKNANLVYEAHDRRDIVCQNIRQEVSIAWHEVYRLQERLRHLEAHRNATDRVRVAYRQQFDIGDRGLLDLLDIENEFFESSRAVANAQHDWAIAHARTQAGMGNLLYALGIAREGMPSLDDLGHGPLEIDPEWICPLENPALVSMAELTNVEVSPAPMPAPAPMEVVTLDAAVLFDFDRHEIRPDAFESLDRLVSRILNTDNVIRVEVVGHTDGVGSPVYNMGLSQRRAASVRQYMVDKGVPADLIGSRGAGLEFPVASNATAQGRQQNRRVEIMIEMGQ